MHLGGNRNAGHREKPNLEPMVSESFTADERRVDFLAKIVGCEEALLHTRVPVMIRAISRDNPTIPPKSCFGTRP